MLYRPPEPRKYTFLDIVSFGICAFARPFGPRAYTVATRGHCASDGQKAMSFMPSGSKMRVRKN